MAAARGILLRSMLAEFGGHVELKQTLGILTATSHEVRAKEGHNSPK